ncbi:MAG: hypothetical protein QOE64_1926, partial [Frankiales bacterium]|nr:hypothetical protein [Frankiales bacterium]
MPTGTKGKHTDMLEAAFWGFVA